VIVLDTNYLLRLLVPESEEFDKVSNWLNTGEELACPAIGWYEFCCGPVSESEQALVLSLLRAGVLPLGEDAAAEAAKLFNATHRAKALKIDCLVAATALVAKAPLATSNLADFRRFLDMGLVLL
jgi:predicted nucleic acid-binding protein